ncbi:MAG: alpha/beta hydrolase [Alphaproteobacteria bacterium]|nr:alpha/beta hydrolase [Alphaproteobacteria bacterium]
MQTEFYLGLNSGGFHKIAVSVWGAQQTPQASDGAVPIICVHGLTRNGRDFDRLAESLSATRILYCPDLPGRGLSDPLSDPMEYSFAQYVKDAVALIARTGAAQVDWVGTSLGGLLGMMLASQPQTPIRRLVLNDVGPFVSKAMVDRLASYMKLEPPTFDSMDELEAHLRHFYAGFGALSDADWRHMAKLSSRSLPDGRFGFSYDPRLGAPFHGETAEVDLWAVYDRVRCPTLLIRGAESEMLPRALAQEMTRRGPCARLVEIEKAAHAPALMDQAQIRLVQDFLNS